MQTRFILINTSHAGNVGAAARAMKTMGFDDLVLVAPRWANVLRREETIQRASGALDVLAKCRIVNTLDEALDGVDHLCATAMTPRDFGPPTTAPRAQLPQLAPRGQSGERIAFVFGSERYGLSNEDVWRCQHCLSIPTAPGYGSLNLAQAVQVLAYEWRQALGGFEVVERTRPPVRASLDAVQGTLVHWRRVLETIGFLDPATPRKLMPRLTQMLLRARPQAEEVHILRGIARAVEQVAGAKPPPAGPQAAAYTEGSSPQGCLAPQLPSPHHVPPSA